MTKQLKQKTGYIYIFDLEEHDILCAILLHDVPFEIGPERDLQKISLVKLKIVKSFLKKHLLAIKAALGNSELIHAQVAFKNLMLSEQCDTGIPNTHAELMGIDQLIVKYRG